MRYESAALSVNPVCPQFVRNIFKNLAISHEESASEKALSVAI